MQSVKVQRKESVKVRVNWIRKGQIVEYHRIMHTSGGM